MNQHPADTKSNKILLELKYFLPIVYLENPEGVETVLKS